MSKVMIKYGNHWLLTDDMRTAIDWIDNQAVASRHDMDWAVSFKQDMRKKNMIVDIYTEELAAAEAHDKRQRKLRETYFYAFDAEVRRIVPEAAVPIPGNGASPFMYAVDDYFARKVPVLKAVEQFKAEFESRPGRRRRKVKK